jgi:hypothetical protein
MVGPCRRYTFVKFDAFGWAPTCFSHGQCANEFKHELSTHHMFLFICIATHPHAMRWCVGIRFIGQIVQFVLFISFSMTMCTQLIQGWGSLCSWCGKMKGIRYEFLGRGKDSVTQWLSEEPHNKQSFKLYSLAYVQLRESGRTQVFFSDDPSQHLEQVQMNSKSCISGQPWIGTPRSSVRVMLHVVVNLFQTN